MLFARRVDRTIHSGLLYGPETNLEREELQMLDGATISVDVAMYSFTDHRVAEELVHLARRGVRVRVYRDAAQCQKENQRGITTTGILHAAGIEVRIKASRNLMHLKSYAIDGLPSANGVDELVRQRT